MSFGPVLRLWRSPVRSREAPGVGVGRVPACLTLGETLVGEGRSVSRFGLSRLPPSGRSRAPVHVTPRCCHSAAAAPASSSLCRPQRLHRAGSPPPPSPPRPPDREGPRLACDSRPDRRVLPAPLGASGGPVVRGVRLLSGRSGCGPGPASLRFPCVPGALGLSSARAPLGPSPAPGSQVSFLPGLSGVWGTAEPPPQGRARESVDPGNRRASPAGKGKGERGPARGAFPGSGPRPWPARGSGCPGPR